MKGQGYQHGMSGQEKRTLNDMLEGLCSKELMGSFVKVLAESVGTSAASAQRFFLKNGHLPAPTLNEVTKLMLHNPDLAKLLDGQMPTKGILTTVTTPNGVGVLGALPVETTTPKTKKKKKKNKKKKTGEPEGAPASGVLRPRNFLEAALYFSTIKMSTVEMAMELEPERFFAPPLLFHGPEGTEAWITALRRDAMSNILDFEQHKAVQRRTTGLFSVALLQTAQHLKPTNSGERPLSVSVRSNYMKRTIGLYAISLVDHLPTSLTHRFLDGNATSNLPRNFLRNNPVLANRKLELNDLKVPSPQQLSDYWAGLKSVEKVDILRAEQTALQKGWINPKKTWCLCKYCRTRALRLGDVYELLYRAYYDDLERVVNEITAVAAPIVDGPLKSKAKKHLFKSLSLLADDVMDEKGSYLTMVLKRLGKAFEDDGEWENECTPGAKMHNEEVCDNCAKYQTKPTNTPLIDSLPDGMDDDSDEEPKEELSDSWDEEDLESFYEDFNMMEDEEVIQAECELPIDPAHLPTSFPALYDPRMYSMPRPAIPAYALHTDDARLADGASLYENVASLLFQFHLVPRYLEAEALARQQRLLEEEEERERVERERAEQKLKVKQRKKEKQKAAKKKSLQEKLDAETDMDTGIDAVTGVDTDAGADLGTDVAAKAAEIINATTLAEESVHEGSEMSEEELPPGLEELPPGLKALDGALSGSTEADSKITVITDLNTTRSEPPGLGVELTGEAPSDIPPTWFDKILNGPTLHPVALWSPLATSQQKEDLPPGFATPVWSPFMH
ncbi:hypothetical protein PSACC_03131 [Paramicrosporidium saccamoebae]|uniref:Stress response protein NST1 n=1 Tax=Paramicrosporidium saccamoebae TaxID=1246581 RepID=A0A2H9TH03_9FUNG|nr:hypothetical protein PSACC_03131 [Paramicrosporidium saccamoebae]